MDSPDSPAEHVRKLEASLRTEKVKAARIEADLRGALTRADKLEQELKAKDEELKSTDELAVGVFTAGRDSAQMAHAVLCRLSRAKPLIEAAEAYYDDPSPANRLAFHTAITEYRAKGKAS